MTRKILQTGLLVLMVIMCGTGCSTVEIRSPIVFHSDQKPAADTGAAPIQQDAAHADVTSSAEAETEITSPAGIKVFSDQDMRTGGFSPLGRITVSSTDKNGFTQEQAVKDLKIMAFKRYGNLAHGIASISYLQKEGFFSGDQNRYREASAVVMTKTEKAQAGTSNEAVSSAEREAIPPLEKIALVSSEELFDRNFRVLGKVSIRDSSPNGISQVQAIQSLKIEAYRLYGSHVKGLTNIKLRKEDPIYFYKKPRYSPPPKVPDGYSKASAEVVYWP